MRVWRVWRVCVGVGLGAMREVLIEVRGVCRAGTGSESMCCVCMRYAGRRWWMRTKREVLWRHCRRAIAYKSTGLCEVQQVCVCDTGFVWVFARCVRVF